MIDAAGAAALIPPSYRSALSGRPAEGPPGMAVTGSDWLRRLPGLLAELLHRWDLWVTGPARHGVAALVIPVTGPSGPAMLKVIWPHPEAATEHLALRRWAGNGAIRLYAADPARWALLLEPADAGHDLLREPIDAACHRIGGLLRTLAVPAMPQLPSLSETAARLREQIADLRSVPHRIVQQAQALCVELTQDPAVDATLTHTDLHFENVLAALRPGREWLAIDPQAQNAEPAFAVTPVLWNRWPEAVRAPSLRAHLRRRVDQVCSGGGIDADRARAWSVVREVQNALWATQDGDADRITQAITIIKAMQD